MDSVEYSNRIHIPLTSNSFKVVPDQTCLDPFGKSTFHFIWADDEHDVEWTETSQYCACEGLVNKADTW